MTTRSRRVRPVKPVPIERALLILPEPLEKILRGQKIWELRSRPTNIRGRIALAAAGAASIRGTCIITDWIGPLTYKVLLAHAGQAGKARSEIIDEREEWELRCKSGGLFAWVLERPRRLPRPVYHRNPPGAVTWVRLPPRVSKRLGA